MVRWLFPREETARELYDALVKDERQYCDNGKYVESFGRSVAAVR